MGDFFQKEILAHFNYWIYVILLMVGLYAMITKNNLIKKLIGMAIFQSAIILFYVSVGVKDGAQIPIADPHNMGGDKHAEKAAYKDDKEKGHGDSHGHGKADYHIEAKKYSNPLPHVLMLTAIVVGVATLGVALAITQVIYRDYGSLEEDEILKKIKASSDG